MKDEIRDKIEKEMEQLFEFKFKELEIQLKEKERKMEDLRKQYE